MAGRELAEQEGGETPGKNDRPVIGLVGDVPDDFMDIGMMVPIERAS